MRRMFVYLSTANFHKRVRKWGPELAEMVVQKDKGNLNLSASERRRVAGEKGNC